MGDILKDLKYYRQALGVNMLWNSYPIIFVVRDGFGIGPSGSIFTILYWGLGILLMLPVNIFQKIYLPNKMLFFFWFAFWALSYIYWKYYPSPNFGAEPLREILTYFIPLGFLFASMYYPNDKLHIIVIVLVFYSILASTGLIYYMTQQSGWQLGDRAGIRFAANTNNSNPHAYANNALAGLLAALIVAGRSKQVLVKVFYFMCALFSLAVMVLARTNISIIALILSALVYFVLHGRSAFLAIFKWQFLVIVGAIAGIIYTLLAQFSKASFVLSVYFQTMLGRFGKVIYTVSGVQVAESSKEIDYSSVNRILSFRYVTEVFLGEGTIGTILFGEGYKAQFFDVPALEALVNQGLVGFVLFNGFFGVVIMTSFQQFFRPANDLSKFMAYFSFIILIALFSGARPIDLSMWLVYIFYVRFFGVYSSSPALETHQTQLTPA